MTRRRWIPQLPRPVWLLSWTSFFTDTASEAVYPLMPLFLARAIGASALSIGIIEGAADAVNSLLRIVSGHWSDRIRARKPFVIAGYGLSSFVRPLVGFATAWPQVFAVRLTDRVGKGIRGAPRDALLTAWADPSTRGYVFGLHRAMDHSGAVVGPLLAALFLWFRPDDYRTLFMLTAIPGLIAVLMLLPVKEAPVVGQGFSPAGDGGCATGEGQGFPALSAVEGSPANRRGGIGGGVTVVGQGFSPAFSRYLCVLFIFALGNSTDAFLLLRMSDAGAPSAWIPLLWAALHVVKAAASPIGGAWSDRVDRRKVIIAGWILYGLVYLAFARVTSLGGLIVVFLVYGLYYALTEGGEKALVADIAPAHARGLAFGWYHAVVGFGSLAASLVFGAIWKQWGAPTAFHTGAALALVAAFMLSRLRLPRGVRL